MPHTEVPEIELRDDDSIAITVEVFGFEAGTPVEISGHATQPNGAIATFYDIHILPPASQGGGSFVTVIATPSPKFVAGGVITVVGRAAEIWGTVLLEERDDQRPRVKEEWEAKRET